MPEELADCSEKGKSYIVVLPQTLVQFNAILVETTLSADDQLQQFFQIYQCIRATLAKNDPKRLSNLHNFLSQLEEFKKYVLTFGNRRKGRRSAAFQLTQSEKHLTDFSETLITDPDTIHTGCESAFHGADNADIESPKEDEDTSVLSACDSGSGKIDDNKIDTDLNQNACETVRSNETAKNTSDTASNKQDTNSKRQKLKRKVTTLAAERVGEEVSDSLTTESVELPESTNKQDKKHLPLKNKKKGKKKTTSIESAAISKKVVEKANYMRVSGKYRCSLCSYCTARKHDINAHCQKHKQRTYNCKDCAIAFETRQALQRHLNLSHKQQAFAFPCPACSSVFGYKFELEEHMLEHPGTSLHHCPKCGKGFSKQEYLTQHLKRCGRQNFTENNEYGKQGKMFFCKLCNYRTEWSTSIKRHRFTHTVVGKPTCEICSKSYCCEGDLRDHVNVAHSNAKFLCCQCGKEFSCRSSLLRHTQVTHELKYKYKCEICSQQFTDRRKMADHMDKHTGARNHICHICGMAYRYKPRLAVHLKRHQNPEPLQCKYCKKTFKNSDTLRVHTMGKHLDRKYPCPYCGKDFIWHKSMSHHKKRCRSRQHIANDDSDVDASLPQAARPTEDEEVVSDERMATDMVIHAAAEVIKAEAPITSNPWKVYQIPTYSSNVHTETPVSNLSDLPICNISSVPMSHLPSLTFSSTNNMSVSNFINFSDVAGSGLSLPGLSSLPVATFSGLPVSSIAELSVVGISNCNTSSAPHLTVSSLSNETITTLSNVPMSSLTSTPVNISHLSEVPVTNMSNMHTGLAATSLNAGVTRGQPNEWKVGSSQVPLYVKDY